MIFASPSRVLLTKYAAIRFLSSNKLSDASLDLESTSFLSSEVISSAGIIYPRLSNVLDLLLSKPQTLINENGP